MRRVGRRVSRGDAPCNWLTTLEVGASGRKVSLLTFGIGAVEMPIQEAYAAAGLKMPE